MTTKFRSKAQNTQSQNTQSQNTQDSTQSQPKSFTIPDAQKTFQALGFITKVLCIIGLVILFLLNLQPWLEVGKNISEGITIIPFQSSLIAIPFVGGWMKWAIAELTMIVGVFLCVAVQLVQIMPVFVRKAYSYKSVKIASATAYIVEFLVVFLRFPPYQSLEDFWLDLFKWDLYLVDWNNLIMFTITIFGFEGLVVVSLKLLDAVTNRRNA
ncbi:MAG: hypothetical protein F6K21_03285 [Symploca sp. SIO2D2]|nr:hypothetical protein [Symploca sp. SIO2D2]